MRVPDEHEDGMHHGAIIVQDNHPDDANYESMFQYTNMHMPIYAILYIFHITRV